MDEPPAVRVTLLEYGRTTILRGGTAPPRKNFGNPRAPWPKGAEVSAKTDLSEFYRRFLLPEDREGLGGREDPVRLPEGGLGVDIFGVRGAPILIRKPRTRRENTFSKIDKMDMYR